MSEILPNNPIRVCFIILKSYPLFNPNVESRFGGAELDLYLLATELAKDKNFNISFVVGDYGQKPIEVHEGVTVFKSVNIDKNLFLGSWRIWRALRRANAHICVGKAFSLSMVLQAFFCKVNKRKYVYRTASAQECNGEYIRQHPLRGRAVIWAIRSAQKVLVQNDDDAKKLLETVNIHSEVIRNGHRLAPSSERPRNTILWTGRSALVKKPHRFLDLARQVPNRHFTMICQRSGGDERYDDLVEQAKQLDNLQFIPRVPFHDIDNYFQRAKVFVNTSDSEGFPNTFIQACSSATPILSLNVNPDTFLDKYNCGLSCDGDWQKFLDGLDFMLAEDRYMQLGQNARKYAEENHDIIKIAEQYKNCFIQFT
jgi:glycosyltransferase involved in cell wall biosynthesis